MTKRHTIIATVVGMLEGITTANDFETNLGLTVFDGEVPELGPDDPDTAIVLTVNTDRPTWQGAALFIRLPMTISAIAKATLDDPRSAIETALGDIKTAMEIEDRTLGGLVPRQFERGNTRPTPREPGSTTVGVSIDYEFPYQELWGTP